MNSRTKILAGILGIVFVVVVADRFLSGAEGATDDGVLTARRRYLDEAALVAQKRALIGHEAEYQAALTQTRASWDTVRSGLVTALSAGLAEAQFRDDILEFVRRRQIEGATIGKLESTPIGDSETLRLITLRLEFSTPSTREVYELIDGLEHMRDMLTRVASVEITGPPRVGGGTTVSVSILMQSIAYVEGES